MKRNVLPYFHIDLLYVEILEAQVDQEKIPFECGSVLIDVVYYLDQDLIAKLLHERDVKLITFDSDRFELVKGLLSIQELLLLTHQTDKLQKYLHHEVALLDERHR